MSYYKHHYKSHHHKHDYYYRPYYHRPYYDLLLYEAMRERDRYRDLYYNSLYEVNPCNPYYASVTGCRLY